MSLCVCFTNHHIEFLSAFQSLSGCFWKLHYGEKFRTELILKICTCSPREATFMKTDWSLTCALPARLRIQRIHLLPLVSGPEQQYPHKPASHSSQGLQHHHKCPPYAEPKALHNQPKTTSLHPEWVTAHFTWTHSSWLLCFHLPVRQIRCSVSSSGTGSQNLSRAA